MGPLCVGEQMSDHLFDQAALHG